jgi:hypothetical protein
MILENINSSTRSCAYKEYVVLFSERIQMTKEGKIQIWFDDEIGVASYKIYME